MPACLLGRLADIANARGEEMQDVLIHLGRSVPAFSRWLLQDTGKQDG